MNYNEFLKTKKRKFEPVGFDVEKESLNNSLFERQKAYRHRAKRELL